MKISECLTPSRVVFLTGATKRETMTELLNALASSPAVTNRNELGQAIWRREELMSTGIGMGLAVPHARLKTVKQVVMAFGVHRAGLTDYGSIDGRPVHILALIAAGDGQHVHYIRLLAQVVDILKDSEVRDEILQQPSADGIYDILAGATGN